MVCPSVTKTLTLGIASKHYNVGLSYFTCTFFVQTPFRLYHNFWPIDLDLEDWPTFPKYWSWQGYLAFIHVFHMYFLVWDLSHHILICNLVTLLFDLFLKTLIGCSSFMETGLVTLQFVIITQFVIHYKLRWIATQFVIHHISNCVVMATRFVMYYKLRQNFIILKYWKGEKNWSTTKCIASIISYSSYYEFS